MNALRTTHQPTTHQPTDCFPQIDHSTHSGSSSDPAPQISSDLVEQALASDKDFAPSGMARRIRFAEPVPGDQAGLRGIATLQDVASGPPTHGTGTLLPLLSSCVAFQAWPLEHHLHAMLQDPMSLNFQLINELPRNARTTRLARSIEQSLQSLASCAAGLKQSKLKDCRRLQLLRVCKADLEALYALTKACISEAPGTDGEWTYPWTEKLVQLVTEQSGLRRKINHLEDHMRARHDKAPINQRMASHPDASDPSSKAGHRLDFSGLAQFDQGDSTAVVRSIADPIRVRFKVYTANLATTHRADEGSPAWCEAVMNIIASIDHM